MIKNVNNIIENYPEIYIYLSIYLSKVGMAKNGQKQGWAPKMTPSSETEIFLGVVLMGKL